MNKIKNFGYIEREITEDNYILGGLLSAPFEVLQENGQWLDFLPENEEQRKEGFESYACTQYGTLNAIEILIKRKFNEIKNYSERFVGVMAENTLTGNDPHNTAEAIRHFGTINDYYLPFSKNLKSYEEYYAPKPMTQFYLDIGKKWLEEYNIRHEYVFGSFASLKDKQLKIMEALKSSPVGVSVVAWFERNGFYYKPDGVKDNHWTICIGYKENEHWIIYDSYDGFIKELEWNYNFGRAKRYWLEKKPEYIKISIMGQIIAKMVKIVELLAKMIKPAENTSPGLVINGDNKKVAIIPPVVETPPISKYSWQTPENIKSSIKKIAIEEKVDIELACRVAQCESGLNPNAKRINNDKHKSVDRGLYQWNNFWHPEITDEMAYNPEIACRKFCKAVKNGHLNWWNASKKCWNVV